MRPIPSKAGVAVVLLSAAAMLFTGDGRRDTTIGTLLSGSAHAEDGGGETGSGAEPVTVERMSISSFLTLSGHEIYRLDLRNARVDTRILIEGYGRIMSGKLIAAAVRDRHTVRALLRDLAAAKNRPERDRIWERADRRAEARYELLRKDELRTYGQIRKEQERLLGDPFARRTDDGEVVSARLTALREAFDEQQARRMGYEIVVSFIGSWNGYMRALDN